MKKFILILILIFAAVLRLWDLGKTPVSMDWDEASLGYNAYSIMKTGRDEFGKSFPVVMESFGDFKPALYTYLIIPFIPVFGLSEIAVRLPAAIIGILAVFLAYLLVLELFKRKDLALISAFLLAVSPWHIQFSRVAFEAGVAMAFNLAAVLYFLKGIKKPVFFSLSAIFFSLSINTYQSEKLFVPLLILILTCIYWKKMFIYKKYLIISGVLFLLVSFPMIQFTLTNENGFARAKGVSFLSDTNSLLQRNVKIIERDRVNHDVIGQLLDNRRVVYFKTVLSGYLSHFDLNWLFIIGDETARHHAPQMSLMYIVELPFLLLGIYFLYFSKFININKNTKLLLGLWVLATPLPASFTTGVPHAVRTLNFLPCWQIMTGLGVLCSYLLLNRYLVKYKILKLLILLTVSVLFLFNFAFYLNQYFVQQNYYYARDWIFGYKELVGYLKPLRSRYKKIIVSNSGYMDQSYIYFLFYEKYDPRKYQLEGGTKISGIERSGNKFLNYEFRKFNYNNENDTPELLIGTGSDFPQVYRVIKPIIFPDGSEAMRVVEKI